MAKFETSGIDGMLATLKGTDILDEETVKELMTAAGKILAAEIKKRVAQSGFATEGYVKASSQRRSGKTNTGNHTFR